MYLVLWNVYSEINISYLILLIKHIYQSYCFTTVAKHEEHKKLSTVRPIHYARGNGLLPKLLFPQRHAGHSPVRCFIHRPLPSRQWGEAGLCPCTHTIWHPLPPPANISLRILQRWGQHPGLGAMVNIST